MALVSTAAAMATTAAAMTSIRGDGPKVIRDHSGVPLAKDKFFGFSTGSECEVC